MTVVMVMMVVVLMLMVVVVGGDSGGDDDVPHTSHNHTTNTAHKLTVTAFREVWPVV